MRIFSYGACSPIAGYGLLILEFSRSHSDTPQWVGLLWTGDQPVAQTSLRDNTQHSQQTNIHDPGGIRTHNLSRRAAADLRHRPRGHWDRHEKRIKKGNHHYSLRNNPEERSSLLLRGRRRKSRFHRYVVTSLLLQPLKQRLIDVTSLGFWNRLILDPISSLAPIILVLCFQIVLIVEFTRPSSRHKSAIFFFSSYFCNHCNISCDAPNCTAAVMSLYQSPV